MIPRSGGEYSYLFEAYSPLSRVVGPVPAFLFAWIMMTLLRPASVAIITLTFATYVLEPFYDVCDASEGAKKCLAAVLIRKLNFNLLFCHCQ
jgi:L-type amino acid transporter 9